MSKNTELQIKSKKQLVFNEHGLLPAGVFEVGMKEAEEFLCFNSHRSRLWANLQIAMQDMDEFGVKGDVFIDGSFVTDKPLPTDIEIIVDVRSQPEPLQGLAVAFHVTKHNYLKQNYEIDLWPNLPGNNDFCMFFQYLGEKGSVIKNLPAKHLKGIIKLIL